MRRTAMNNRIDHHQLRRDRFEAVFTEVYEPVQRYARRRVDADVVDDIVADTMLTLWRRLDDVPVDVHVPWAYGVARRHIANWRRSSGRRVRLLRRVAIEPSNSSVPDHPLEVELQAALAALDGADRELLELWAWEQLEAAELAIVLGITANAASIRLHRAKKRLTANFEIARKNEASSGHSHHVRRSKEDWS
jgi:RNA polymerase sigma-70 factor (ECF subfamily)